MFAGLKFLSFITGWLAAGGVVVVVALAVGWYLPAFRQIAIAVAVAALSSTFFLAKGVHLGISLEKARWAAAEQRAEQLGSTARENAERTIAAEPDPAPVPDTDVPTLHHDEPAPGAPVAADAGHGRGVLRLLRPRAGRVRHDPYDRDNP